MNRASRDVLLREMLFLSAKINKHDLSELSIITYLDGQRFRGMYQIHAMESVTGDKKSSVTFVALFGAQFSRLLDKDKHENAVSVLSNCAIELIRMNNQVGLVLEKASDIYKDVVGNVYRLQPERFEYEVIVTVKAVHKDTGIYIEKSGSDWTGKKQKEAITSDVVSILALLAERYREIPASEEEIGQRPADDKTLATSVDLVEAIDSDTRLQDTRD